MPPYGIEKCRGETLRKELEDIARAEEWTSSLVFHTFTRTVVATVVSVGRGVDDWLEFCFALVD